MPSRRTIKKTLYATAFFSAIAVFLFLVVPFTLRNRVEVAPSPTPNPYTPIVLEQRAAIFHERPDGSRSVDVVAQLRNPNSRAGVGEYPVTFTVFGASGEEVLRHQEMTYLLPGALQYAAALDLPLAPTETVSRVEVTLPAHEQVEFSALPEGISAPEFQAFAQGRQQREVGGQVIETQVGLVRNTSTFDWQQVEVVAVGLNAQQRIVTIGKTFLGRLLVGEQREFVVQWPAASEPIQNVIVLPSTNMFNEANLVDILGNAESLQ